MIRVNDHDILARILAPKSAELLLRPSVAVSLVFFGFLGGGDAGLSGFGALEKVSEVEVEVW